MEPAINQLHIFLATGNQSTAYQSIGTYNKIDNINHQDNFILADSYFSSYKHDEWSDITAAPYYNDDVFYTVMRSTAPDPEF